MKESIQLSGRASQHSLNEQQEGINVSHIAAKRYEGSGFTQAALRGAQYLGANLIDDIVENTVVCNAETIRFLIRLYKSFGCCRA
jgi:hypothetical protein